MLIIFKSNSWFKDFVEASSAQQDGKPTKPYLTTKSPCQSLVGGTAIVFCNNTYMELYNTILFTQLWIKSI